MKHGRIAGLFFCLACLACTDVMEHSSPAVSTALFPTGDWPHWGNDPGGGRFSTLDQINTGNVGDIEVAWTWHSGEIADGNTPGNPNRTTFECTPIVVEGVMYVTTPFCRAVALDPESGEEIWSFDPGVDLSVPHNLMINRGAALWRGPGGEKSILLGTMDGGLWRLDAATGKPVVAFGESGRVPHGSLGPGGRRLHGDEASPENLPTEWEGAITSAPVIFRDLVIVGGLLPHLRAYSIHTGELVWERNKVLGPDDPDRATWEGKGLDAQGSAFSWPPMSVDTARGLLFVPTDSPTPDFYGGARHGDNRPCNSLLVLDAATGGTVWQFQISHHDVWDYDIPAQPNLITVTRNGEAVDAVAQITKQGLLFLFERETGRPLFDIDELPVEPSRVPGEYLSPTQPFPVAPPPFARQGAGPVEYNRVTPELDAKAREAFRRYRMGGLYSAPSLEGVICFPNTIGGGAWGGGCYDPRTGLYYVSASNVGTLMKMVKTSDNPLRYRRVTDDLDNGRFWDNETRIPHTPPPWSTLTALDLNDGTIAWQRPLGIVPSLAERGITDTGCISIGGGIVTAGGLVFIAATNDSRFRAFDSASGDELWVSEIPGSGHAVPMTYLGEKSGKQFVVIAAGGGNKYNDTYSDALVAFSLP